MHFNTYAIHPVYNDTNLLEGKSNSFSLLSAEKGYSLKQHIAPVCDIALKKSIT